jgi:hypothetical protein
MQGTIDVTTAIVRGTVMSAGARTPEELETLFEDALVIRDRDALAELFDEGSVFVANGGSPARGEAIVQLVLATWDSDHIYVADPRRVMQARNVALIVADHGISVVRRRSDGTWRYAIVVLSVDATER